MDNQQYARDYSQVVKFSAKVPPEAIHPSLHLTRLGAWLRGQSQRDDTVGQLSRTILTSNPNQPLELTPLHAMRDLMLENPSEPLAQAFNWDYLPEKFALDTRLKSAIHTHNKRNIENGLPGLTAVEPHHFTNPPEYDPTDVKGRVKGISDQLEAETGMGNGDVADAARRLHEKTVWSRMAESPAQIKLWYSHMESHQPPHPHDPTRY